MAGPQSIGEVSVKPKGTPMFRSAKHLLADEKFRAQVKKEIRLLLYIVVFVLIARFATYFVSSHFFP